MTTNRLKVATQLYEELRELNHLYKNGLPELFKNGKHTIRVIISIEVDERPYRQFINSQISKYILEQQEKLTSSFIKFVTKAYNKKQKEFEKA